MEMGGADASYDEVNALREARMGVGCSWFDQMNLKMVFYKSLLPNCCLKVFL